MLVPTAQEGAPTVKITRADRDQLVLTQRNFSVRLLGVLVVLASVVAVLSISTEQSLRCDATVDSKVCVLTERTLVGLTTTTRIAAEEVRRLEVEVKPGSDTHCVVIATHVAHHHVGRCSEGADPRQSQLVTELKGFYAGEVSAVVSEHSDTTYLWFVFAPLGLFGLFLVVAPAICRVRLDRKSGVLTKRTWSFGRARTEKLALADIGTVTVEEAEAGPEGNAHEQLVAHMHDGRRVPLNRATAASLAEPHAAVLAFLKA